MPTEFAIVDLFAGPGGLAEGFSSIRSKDGSRSFRMALSVEKEPSAFKTLLLRSFLRQFDRSFPPEYYHFLNNDIPEPDWSTLYPRQWKRACHETLNLELGSKAAAGVIDARLRQIRREYGGNVVLIGGPPCQAYSLVGRARNKGIEGYKASKDPRHFLYKEYIRILEQLRPAAFVMENVKGLLSSSIDGESMFDRVLDDLSAVGGGAYRLIPLAPRSGQAVLDWLARPPATDFVVRSEDFGVPQSRHRVIIIGVRDDVADVLQARIIGSGLISPSRYAATVRNVIGSMPKLRSGLSQNEDDNAEWRVAVSRVLNAVARVECRLPKEAARRFRTLASKAAAGISSSGRVLRRSGGDYSFLPAACAADLRQWLTDPRLRRFANNETRSHMLSDLGRYFFASIYGKITGNSPKAGDFPDDLAPKHRNWKTGKFADRFRVQLWNAPATTITSHISKDGHYFIHPDPAQCRSLTVREAARLQTFPDNYFFMGNRTQQFVQVGNAVPPFLARKIAVAIHSLLERAAPLAGRQNLKKAG